MNDAVTTKRQPNGFHAVLLDGRKVGEIWRRPNTRSFGLRLEGYYWSKGEANTRAGLSTTTTQRKQDALALATSVLTQRKPA